MKKYLLAFLLIILIAAFWSQIPDSRLHIYICDVGQGDGILLTKGSTQIVIDAGPNNSIESCLGRHIPFWDKTIEVAFMTHADSDHSYGFIQLFERYKILHFISNPLRSTTSSNQFEHLKDAVAKSTTKVSPAVKGSVVKVQGITLQVISPDRSRFSSDLSSQNSSILGSVSGNTNDLCSVVFLKYQSFTALFPCDLSPSTEAQLVSLSEVPQAYVLKIPHHGSKNGLTQEFLQATDPKLAVISVGLKNRYGLPDEEVLRMLRNFPVKTIRTDISGEIEIKTDGKTVWTK